MTNNTQLVSVPRELLARITKMTMFTLPAADYKALTGILAAPAQDVRAVEDGPVLPELNSDLRGILGRPNFTCNGIAQALRQMGRAIPNKSEEEQAATIYWMLGHYLRDPANWRDSASAELKAGAPAPPAQQ